MMSIFFLFALLAAANAFSLINETYVALNGEYLTNASVDFAQSSYAYAYSVFANVQFVFFLCVFAIFCFLLKPAAIFVYYQLYILYRIIRPCVPVKLYKVLTGTARKRGAMWTQGDSEPGVSGISQTIDPVASASTAMASIIDKNPDMVVESTPPKLVDATVIGDDIDCNQVRNTLFSGEIMSASMPYRRRRPPSDMMYRSNTSEYNTNAKIDSFTLSSSATPGFLVYEKSVSQMIAASPKFNYLRTLWTYFRFGVKIVVQPTVNPMASGVIAASVNSFPTFTTLNPAARDLWYRNLGAFPTVFMQCSANQHAEITIPDVVLDRWLNNEYIAGASPATLTSFTLGHFGVFVVCPYVTNTGGPTSLRYNVFLQLVDVHCKWPQAARYLTQGIIDFNTSVNVIDKMTNSSLSSDIRGGDGAVSASGFGFDLPSDTRQYQPMMRRVFQRMFPTRGKLDINRLTFNQSDGASYPFIGQDQMSIKWIMSRRNWIGNSTLSSTDVADNSLGTFRILTPPLSLAATTWALTSDVIQQLGIYSEFDEVVFTFIIPKVPYQNGKYLVTLTSGINPPASINSANLSMTSAPSMIIDLSAPDVAHEFRVPFTLLSEYYTNMGTANSMRHAVPRLAVYCVNPITTNIMAPSSITMAIWRHFENYRLIYPQNSVATQGGKECVSTGAKVNLENDSVYTRKIDDGISLKQFMTPSVIALCREMKLDTSIKSCSINMRYDALLRSLPFGGWYRFYNGSVRLGIQVIPYFEGGPTDRVDQVLLTFSRRNFTAEPTATAQTGSPFSKLINDLPVVSSTLSEITNFQSDIYNQTSTAYMPGYPQFPILLDTTSERMTFVELPLLGPNGYIDLFPQDTVNGAADLGGFTVAFDPIFKGAYVDGTILKVIFWVSAGDDLQAWGFNPMNDGTVPVVGTNPYETLGGVKTAVMPFVNSFQYTY